MAPSTHDFSTFTVHVFDVSADTEREKADAKSSTLSIHEGTMMVGGSCGVWMERWRRGQKGR